MTPTADALFDVDPPMRKHAEISDDGVYRYGLVRRWSDHTPFATFIMLNPSTADGENDDPTIRRCIGFARTWGMGALHVVNLYAYRATDPKVLWTVPDPVGPDADEHLARHAMAAQQVRWPLIAAWGANARADRVQHVLRFPGMRALEALGTTKAGAPRHPLYLPADAARRPWPGHLLPDLPAEDA